MRLHNLINSIAKDRNINLTEEDIYSVVASCRLADVPDDISLDSVKSMSSVVNIAIDSHTNRIIAESVPEIETDKCPLCNKEYIEAELIQGRKVKYCQTHRVAMPTRKS
jgi:hypothetical protein